MFNTFVLDILEKLDISNYKILKNNNLYIINNLIHILPHYDAPPSDFTDSHIYIYNMLRNKLNIENKVKYKKIYLKRDSYVNKTYGNDEIGILRQIINENEIIAFLKNNNFEIITLGDKNINDKCILLNDAKIIITPLGANCMNFIYANAPEKIIYLSNNEMFGDNYFTSLSKILNNNYPIESILLRFKTEYNLDKNNQWNGSFYVDIDFLKEYI
jgi:capsular polysaccharide biosynthesis protein